MRCKGTIVQLFAALLFGIAAIGFSTSGMDAAVTHNEIQRNSLSCFPSQSVAAPSEMFQFTAANQPESEFMARLFQLMFILFFISPPIIALMLFLIWRELKARNKMK